MNYSTYTLLFIHTHPPSPCVWKVLISNSHWSRTSPGVGGQGKWNLLV